MTPRRPHTHGAPGRRGLTMIEAVISLIVISVLGLAALRAFSAATLTRALAHDRARGVALAHDLLAEVAAAPYGEPMAKASELDERLTLATVGDYHGWSASPPVALDGAALAPGLWRREVTVQQVELDGVTPAAAATGVVRVSVRVLKGDRLVATAQALRTAAWGRAAGAGP